MYWQDSFSSNILHSTYVGSMLGQRRRRWSNIKIALGQCLVWVVSCNQFSCWYYCVSLYSIGYCMPTRDRPTHARFAVEWIFKHVLEKKFVCDKSGKKIVRFWSEKKMFCFFVGAPMGFRFNGLSDQYVFWTNGLSDCWLLEQCAFGFRLRPFWILGCNQW